MRVHRLDATKGAVASYMRDLRRELGHSQADFGKVLSRSQRAVSRWETGDAELSVEEFIVICRRLQRSPVEEMKKLLSVIDGLNLPKDQPHLASEFETPRPTRERRTPSQS